MTRHTPRPGFYRTRTQASADHAVICALVDGTDARAASVTARAGKVASCTLAALEARKIAAWVRYAAMPEDTPAQMRRKDEAAEAYLDANDALRRAREAR